MFIYGLFTFVEVGLVVVVADAIDEHSSFLDPREGQHKEIQKIKKTNKTEARVEDLSSPVYGTPTGREASMEVTAKKTQASDPKRHRRTTS